MMLAGSEPCYPEPVKDSPITRRFNLVVERHEDGFVAFPLGLRGVVVGQGDSHDAAVADATSAIRFHIESFGAEALADG